MKKLFVLLLFVFSVNAFALPGEDFKGEDGCVCKDKTCTADEILYLANFCQSPIEIILDKSTLENEIFLCPGCVCPDGKFGTKDEFYIPSKYRLLGDSYSKKKTLLTCHNFDPANLEKIMNCITDKTNLKPCPLKINPTGCPKIDSLLSPTVIASYESKRNCGFSWNDFTANGNQRIYYKNLKAIKEDLPQVCYKSMCTSATFEAFVYYMKQALVNGKVTQEQFDKHTKWNYGSLGYNHINLNATPDALVEELGIGKGFQQHRSELGENNIPKTGDLIQLWRKSGSGHSAVFKGLVDIDGDKKYDLLCYVSSQKSTNGVGENCEEIKYLDRVLIGSLDELVR